MGQHLNSGPHHSAEPSSTEGITQKNTQQAKTADDREEHKSPKESITGESNMELSENEQQNQEEGGQEKDSPTDGTAAEQDVTEAKLTGL